MFTGLVEDIGTIASVLPRGAGRLLTIHTALPMGDVAIGDSIAVDGACLTAESFVPGGFAAVAAAETIQKTTLASARSGRKVHLERALRLGSRLDGHLVQGHVDGVGRVSSSRGERESWVLWVDAPPDLSRFIATKGSIAIDGVSLTVNEVNGAAFRVNIIPHSQYATRLASVRAGDGVNLEVDVLARYVGRMLDVKSGGLDLEALRRGGF